MATTIDSKAFAKLVSEVKKDLKSGEGKVTRSETALSEASGIPMSQIGKAIYMAELEADPSLKIAQTGGAITKARNGGMRWPRIAARTGLSVSKVQALFEEASGTSAADSYTGRGRKSFGGSTAGTSGSKSSSAGSKSKSASGRGTSGRRSSAKTKTAAPKTRAATAKRGTRRGSRSTAASDPK